MTLEQKIRDQIDRIVGTHIYNIIWHPVARAPVDTDLFLYIDKALRETVMQSTNRIGRALLPKLYEYNFTK
jgi:hypothetical protein